MTPDQWNAFSQIMTPVGLAVASLVFAVVGFFIVREIRQNDDHKKDDKQDKKDLRRAQKALELEVRELKTRLEDRGIIPTKLKFPSPPPQCIEDDAG